jgi:hypothetical protein
MILSAVDKLDINAAVDLETRARYLESEERFCPFCEAALMLLLPPERCKELSNAVLMRVRCASCGGEITEVFIRHEVELGCRGSDVKLNWRLHQVISMEALSPSGDHQSIDPPAPSRRWKPQLWKQLFKFDAIPQLTCPLCGLEDGSPVHLTTKIVARYLARCTARCGKCNSAWIERFRLNDFQVEIAPPVSRILAAPYRQLQ